MGRTVTKKDAEKLLGKDIVAYKKDGSIVAGKLVKISGNRLYVRQKSGKKVHTKAIAPLVLFDLLAIGTSPFAFGGFGPFGGFGGFGPFGFGRPFIW